MDSEKPKADTENALWSLERIWFFVSSALAIIALVDLGKQLITWASLIHWIAERYAAAREWLFGWIPFHIPPDWHDFILLSAVFFSVVSAGYYKRTQRIFLVYVIDIVFVVVVSVFRDPSGQRFNFTKYNDAGGEAQEKILEEKYSQVVLVFWFYGVILSLPVAYFLETRAEASGFGIIAMGAIFIFVFGACIFLALPLAIGIVAGVVTTWRWILMTAGAFLALIVVNEIYVRWLEPMDIVR
jgi:hypothetical protein